MTSSARIPHRPRANVGRLHFVQLITGEPEGYAELTVFLIAGFGAVHETHDVPTSLPADVGMA